MTLEGYTFEHPKRTIQDCVPISEIESGRMHVWGDLFQGLVGPEQTPDRLTLPNTLWPLAQSMRTYALQNDNEQCSGIYRSEGATLNLLLKPEDGEYNAIDKVYESGNLPVITGMEAVCTIHSHPSMQRLAGMEPDHEIRETTMKENQWFSPYDYVELLIDLPDPHRTPVQSALLIAPEHSLFLARTTQSPNKGDPEAIFNRFVDMLKLEQSNNFTKYLKNALHKHPYTGVLQALQQYEQQQRADGIRQGTRQRELLLATIESFDLVAYHGQEQHLSKIAARG